MLLFYFWSRRKKIQISFGIISLGSLCWQPIQKNQPSPTQTTQTIIQAVVVLVLAALGDFPKTELGYMHTSCKHCCNRKEGETAQTPAAPDVGSRETHCKAVHGRYTEQLCHHWGNCWYRAQNSKICNRITAPIYAQHPQLLFIAHMYFFILPLCHTRVFFMCKARALLGPTLQTALSPPSALFPRCALMPSYFWAQQRRKQVFQVHIS